MSTRYPKLAGKTFLMVAFIGPLLVGLFLALLLALAVVVDRAMTGRDMTWSSPMDLLQSFEFIMLAVFFVGTLPAVIAGFLSAVLVWRRGKASAWQLAMMAAVAGMIGWPLIFLRPSEITGHFNWAGLAPGSLSFAGLGLLAVLFLWPFFRRMKVVGK